MNSEKHESFNIFHEKCNFDTNDYKNTVEIVLAGTVKNLPSKLFQPSKLYIYTGESQFSNNLLQSFAQEPNQIL